MAQIHKITSFYMKYYTNLNDYTFDDLVANNYSFVDYCKAKSNPFFLSGHSDEFINFIVNGKKHNTKHASFINITKNTRKYYYLDKKFNGVSDDKTWRKYCKLLMFL